MNTQEIVNTIHERVSVHDAVRAFTQFAPRRDRIPCPIHGGSNYNLGFTDNLYHCFVCNDGGDVIRFVQHIRGVGFRDACLLIGEQFGLNLHFDRPETFREREQIRREADHLFLISTIRSEQLAHYEKQYDDVADHLAFWDRAATEFNSEYAARMAEHYNGKLYDALADLEEARR